MKPRNECSCKYCRRERWAARLGPVTTGLIVGLAMTPVWVSLVRATATGNALLATVLDGLLTALVWSFSLTIAERPTWWFVIGITVGSMLATYWSLT